LDFFKLSLRRNENDLRRDLSIKGENMDNANAQLISRLRWQCRRGMKELDLLLTRYLDDHYANASMEEQSAFQGLLELSDQELFSYVIGREAISNPYWVQILDKASVRK
jgi:antitoxin CptB